MIPNAWLATEMERVGLLSSHDLEDILRNKSLLNDTGRAEIMMTSLKKNVWLNSMNLRTFVDILKAKPRLYSIDIYILEGKQLV